MIAAPFEILNTIIEPGERKEIRLPLPGLFDGAPQEISVYVFHGKYPGKVLLLMGAVHGDELNGIEIIRRIIKSKKLRQINGTIIAVPVVNIYGLIYQQRYLMDRRDLNRSFPGTNKGSLASRIAYTITHEILRKATHIIDLHTAAVNRSNLPQARTNFNSTSSVALAKAFAAPVILNSKIRDGSLRKTAQRYKIPTIVYESGEALRLDEAAIKIGTRGIFNVMHYLEMINNKRVVSSHSPIICQASAWIRAKDSGLFSTTKSLGSKITEQCLVGKLAMPMERKEEKIYSPVSGIIIGMNKIPLVHEGAALFNIGLYDKLNRKQLKTLELLDSDDVEIIMET